LITVCNSKPVDQLSHSYSPYTSSDYREEMAPTLEERFQAAVDVVQKLPKEGKSGFTICMCKLKNNL